MDAFTAQPKAAAPGDELPMGHRANVRWSQSDVVKELNKAKNQVDRARLFFVALKPAPSAGR